MRAASTNGCAWTADEMRLVRKLYPTHSASQIAKRLDRSLLAVYQKARDMGLLKKPKTRIDDAVIDRIRTGNAQGYSDQEIADAIGCERHTVSRYRVSMDLPCNTHNDRHRAKTRIAAERQLATAGLSTMGQLRSRALKERAAAAGWPTDLPMRAVEILDLLSTHGPMTRRELCDAMGMPWKGTRWSLKYKGEGGSYPALLINRGLVVSLGRIWLGGKGRHEQIYSLAITAERRFPDVAS